jgi:RNA polymerase sigma factor (sigma-70 family)
MPNLTSPALPEVTSWNPMPGAAGPREFKPLAPARRNRGASEAGLADRQGRVEANVRLASYAVQRFLRRYHIPAAVSLDSDDLVSEAFLVLCQAAESWDPARGTFATYAVAAIHNRLLKVCRLERGSPIASVEFISLHAPVDDEGGRCIEDLLPAVESPEERLIDGTQIDVQKAIAELPERDRQVVLQMMAGGSAASIARSCGCSPQRVRQIQMRAYHRLRLSLCDHAEGAGSRFGAGHAKATGSAGPRRQRSRRLSWEATA